MTATWFIVYRTAFGRVVRAGVQNPDIVGALGISLAPYMTAIAALGVGLAGLAGVLLAPISGVHPAMGAEILTAAFVVVVIGGLGSFWGVIAAAMLVGVVRGVTIYFNPSWGEASMYLADGARAAAASARAARRAHREVRVDADARGACAAHRRRCCRWSSFRSCSMSLACHCVRRSTWWYSPSPAWDSTFWSAIPVSFRSATAPGSGSAPMRRR